jgi:hypothetical protein
MTSFFQVAELIKANNLWSRNAIYCKKTLTIPVSKEKYLMLIEQQKHQLKRIQRNQQKMIKYQTVLFRFVGF